MKSLLHSALLILCSSLTLTGQIVINEIIPPSTVELRNLGAATVNISAYTLCQFPSYNQLSNITQVCGGDLMIEGGSIIAVNVTFNISAANDEMALYLMNGSFENPANIIDYVEWGSSGHTRSSVAVAAGIWTTGDFVPSFAGCASIEYDGVGNASTDWVSQDVATSPCVANSLDGCGGSNCDIAGAGLSNINCNDNGSPSNPIDDFISFNLNPTGIDLGNAYSVSVSSGTISPPGAVYGSPTMFQLQSGSAGDGNVTLTIADNDDPSCTFLIVVTDPGSCSDECDITAAGLSGIFCNDNDTPSSGTDDFIMFNLDPDGLNLGISYSVSVSSGSITPNSANYGPLTTFNLNTGSAGNGNVTVTLTDDDNASCTITALIVDPGTCSDDCDLTAAGLADIECDDNGTGSDADDVITFTLNPTGLNLSPGYEVSVSNGNISPTLGLYGSAEVFSLNAGSAGAGNVTLTIRDADDPGCDIEVVVIDPGACSESCNISGLGLSGVACNDNNTGTDPADDFIVFILDPTGVNLGATYSVSVSAGTVMPTSGTYGPSTEFTLNIGSAGAGNITITVADNIDASCTRAELITDPGTCSDDCNLTSAGLDLVVCNSNGTTDEGDDFISFILNPTGISLSASYLVSVSAGTVSPDTVAYGGPVAFDLNMGSAGDGNVTVTITDLADPTCTISVVVTDPGTCSESCNLTSSGLTNILCNDNGTTESNDDFVSFSLNPEGSLLGIGYQIEVSSGTVTPMNAAYGVSTSFVLNNGSAGSGDVIITISDDGDVVCSLVVMITDPGVCSENPCDVSACDISSNSETMICVDEGGDPDSVVVICHPGSISANAAWIVTDTNGLIQLITASSDTASFTFEGQSSGVCLIWLVAYDGNLSGLTIGADADTLSGCFDLSNPISVTKLTGTECESSTFNPELNDLISLYPIPVSGLLRIDAEDVIIHRISVMDVIGRSLFRVDQINPASIDMSDLDMGLYYVMIETNLGWNLHRVVVGR